MSAPTDVWRRHALLAISIGLVAGGFAMGFSADATGNSEFARGVLIKSGVVLFMLWLALPQLERLNPWTAVPIGIVSLLAIFRPTLLIPIARAAVFLAPVLFLIWMIRSPIGNKRRP